MRKKIKIGAETYAFTSTAYTPIEYRQEFNEDYFEAIDKISEDGDYECKLKLTYVLLDDKKMGFTEFAKKFTLLDIVKVFPEILELTIAQSGTINVAPNQEGTMGDK